MNRYRRLQPITNERGAIAVVTALVLVVLLLATAFVTDFGLAYLSAAELQNAADSAALAAASLLPTDVGDSAAMDEIEEVALDYLEKNGNGWSYTADVKPEIGGNNQYTSVTVSISRSVPLYIAPVIGIDHVQITRSATAQISPTIETSHMVPLSITEEYLTQAMDSGETQHLKLKFGASSDDVYKGAFGAIDLDGSGGGGASDYEEWLANGYEGKLYVGLQLPVETGNMSNPTMSGFEDRYNSCMHGGCTISDYVEDCPRVVIVPVITYDDAHTVTIEGFTAFVIEKCDGQGKNSIITGSFIKELPVTGTGSLDDGLGSNIDFGVYSITLIG
jgi:Flp pilus assembly protein TadG